jgi:hypothetical protein
MPGTIVSTATNASQSTSDCDAGSATTLSTTVAGSSTVE